MCYNGSIKSARFLRLPVAALAIADSGPVGKEGALRTMLACQVVLLTSPESFHPKQLLSRQQPTPRKSFSCNTYGFPRKCCKQKTYGMAKSFRCNTYKK